QQANQTAHQSRLWTETPLNWQFSSIANRPFPLLVVSTPSFSNRRGVTGLTPPPDAGHSRVKLVSGSGTEIVLPLLRKKSWRALSGRRLNRRSRSSLDNVNEKDNAIETGVGRQE